MPAHVPAGYTGARCSAALVLAALPAAALVPLCTGAGCARAGRPTPVALGRPRSRRLAHRR
eukprot:4530834-Alexandrium_andersonii.AAC.1